jgi:hypothetical protein
MRLLLASFAGILVLATGVVVTGCGLAQQALMRQELEAHRKAHEAAEAECHRLYPDPNRKPATPKIKCLADVHLRFATNDPHIDLLRMMTSQMLVIGERYDTGKITVAQFEAEKAAAFSDYTTRVAQRQNGAAMAEAAQQQANAATWQAYSANRPRTCNTWGNTVNCY